jgi:hypothetical protein
VLNLFLSPHEVSYALELENYSAIILQLLCIALFFNVKQSFNDWILSTSPEKIYLFGSNR